MFYFLTNIQVLQVDDIGVSGSKPKKLNTLEIKFNFYGTEHSVVRSDNDDFKSLGRTVRRNLVRFN